MTGAMALASLLGCLVGVAAACVAFCLWAPRAWKRRLLLPLLRGGPPPPRLADKPYARRVEKHGALQQPLAERPLWVVSARLPQPGPKFSRNMVVYRNPHTGGLWIHSPVCLDARTKAELEGLGRVECIVIPNSFHRLDAEAYAKEYPHAKVVCPKVPAKLIKAVTVVHATCEDTFPEADSGGAGVVQYLAPAGLVTTIDDVGELVYLLDLGDGKSALVFCDLFFNLSCEESDFLMKRVASGFGPTAFGKIVCMDTGRQFCEWILNRLIPKAEASNVEVIVVGHGDIVVGKTNVMKALHEAASKVKDF
ncbi:MAG: hypothetical protein SGPRY_011885 [Prymnesium sp.]